MGAIPSYRPVTAYIRDIVYFLPERVVGNAELVVEFPEWSVEKIASKVGIGQRHIAADSETSGDLAVQAAEKLFAQGKVAREEIDYLLFCTQSPDYFLPTTACILQDRLGLRTDIGALDFNMGCSGYIYGLSLAKGLIAGGMARNVLLLTGETYTKFLHPKDKGNRTIFGDAATASVISTDGVAEIGGFSLGTDGRGAENLMVKVGGMRCREKQDDLHFDTFGNPVSSDYLFMNGGAIFTFTQQSVPPLVQQTLEVNQLKADDIGLYVFHQANRYMLNFLRKKIGIPEEKFYYCLADVGNTVSNTIPIALCEARGEGRIHSGVNVLMVGFGVGYSWGGTVLRFV